MNKQHILDEIRRTAATNGGRPLGRKRFEHETGIRESDWRGKYWARWNDAIKAAGLSPNQLTSAYDNIHLLERLAGLVRELGRFPTVDEIRLKRRLDPEFPSQTVYKRFGNKTDQAGELLKYCLTAPGLEDVAELCRSAAGISAPEQDVDDQSDASDHVEYGYVYLIKSGRYYKIGYSNAAGRREYEIALQLPEKATKVHEIRTDDPPGIERYWHERFKEKRRNGEWFELEASDVKAFKRRKFM